MVKNTVLVLVTFLMLGCATNYKVGDISRAYCGSTDPEFRAQVKVMLRKTGVDIGVDYCSVHGLVDVMLQNK